MDRLTRKASKQELIDSKYLFNYVDNSKDLNLARNPIRLSNAYDKLGKLEDIEEDLGCPLEALYKIKKSKQIYIDTYTVETPIGATTSIVKGMYKVIGIDIFKNKIQCLVQFSDLYRVFYVPMYEYKVGWFLKEDRSE